MACATILERLLGNNCLCVDDGVAGALEVEHAFIRRCECDECQNLNW